MFAHYFIKRLKYNGELMQDWRRKGLAGWKTKMEVNHAATTLLLHYFFIGCDTIIKHTRDLRRWAQFLRIIQILQEYCQSNYTVRMGQWEPFCKSICTHLSHLRDAKRAEMIPFSLIFKVVYMMMSKGWAFSSVVIIPLYNWKNVDSRNIKNPICIYNLISYE